ncbi:glycosyltransferase [Marinoscillum pacificum]|uniref:glycosyltransferase n=1 Tax=Marinoscillum pacificum TaxID=392723 RepID=UPI002157CE1A|nr:glycosyltransferase [Marinoscillum pacificum]
MDFKHKNILIISPEPWHHIHVSKHHYALELAKNDAHVFFLNPPTHVWQCQNTSQDNLKVVDYSGFWPGLYRLPGVFRRANQRAVLRKLKELVQCHFDIVWSFDNSVFYDMEVFGSAFKISHIVDLSQDFQTARAARSADLCLGVIPKIVDRLRRYNDNTYLIKHGVHIYPCSEQVTLPGDGKVKALYFGNLKMPHLDWSLLRNAAMTHAEVDFVLLGSGHESVPADVSSLLNVHLLYPVPSEDLSCYMNAADILLLFYQKEYYMNYASPHKMMEYLSSGKPIVASYTADYKQHEDLIQMARTQEEWLEELAKTIDLQEKGEEQSLATRRISLCYSNAYDQKVGYIGGLISSLEV